MTLSKKTAIPEWKSTPNRNKLRVWSAGSSTGEEAYSVAMTLSGSIPSHWDTKILATDIDTDVVARGRSAVYSSDRLGSLKPQRVSEYFDKVTVDGKAFVRVKKSLREMTHFKALNLLQAWPMSGQFKMILCRNVVIYFDKATQKVLFDRFADLLVVGGFLLIGHSESVYKLSDRFTSLGNTVYRKLK